MTLAEVTPEMVCAALMPSTWPTFNDPRTEQERNNRARFLAQAEAHLNAIRSLVEAR